MLNVNLWFARNKDEQIVSILEAHEHEEYTCPVCGSDVIPKALSSRKVTPHYAHIDKSKCDSESMLHWWFKNKFIEKGDTFSIKTDELYTYTCESIEVEKTFHLESGDYRPDVIVHTTDGEEIVFEMANTNKKKVQDYIDRWIELDRVVVEVDIKSLTSGNKTFNALYYKGKCYNFNKRDGGYYNTIGKLKERMIQEDKYDIELVKKLDWFWEDVIRYKNNDISIDDIFNDIELINKNGKKIIDNILKNTKCSDLLYKYHLNKSENEYLELKNEIERQYDKSILKYVKYDLSTDINGFYFTRISRYDISDRTWWVNTEESNFSELLLKVKETLDKNINYLKEKDDENSYNEFSDEILNEINKNYNLNKFTNELNANYRLQVRVLHLNEGFTMNNTTSRVSKSDMQNKLHYINASLSYNGKLAVDFTVKFENEHLDTTISKIINRIGNYFTKLDKITDVTFLKINNITNKLKFYFNNCEVEIFNERVLEDRYDIKVKIKDKYSLSSYSITNKYVYKYYWEEKYEIDDKMGVYFLKENIEKDILRYYRNWCKDCSNEFTISIQELKFFNKKNLTLPKRCKSCRQKRKHQKEVN